MPEGDTVFKTARALDRALAGHTVVRFHSVFPQLTRIHQDEPVTGRTVERVTARGKHLLMTFSGDLVLRTHLRMHGSWHLYPIGQRWRRPRAAMRIVLATDAVEAVAFDVPVAELTTRAGVERELAALGPDLLAHTFDEADAVRRLRALGDCRIGDALLEQRAMAGVGNVFKSEICFACRVHPATPVERLDDEQLRELVRTARRQLQANVVEHGPHGPAPAPWRRRTTRLADPRASLWVYGRAGRACRRCGGRIEVARYGEDIRLTYWCPRCQPAVPPAASTA